MSCVVSRCVAARQETGSAEHGSADFPPCGSTPGDIRDWHQAVAPRRRRSVWKRCPREGGPRRKCRVAGASARIYWAASLPRPAKSNSHHCPATEARRLHEQTGETPRPLPRHATGFYPTTCSRREGASALPRPGSGGGALPPPFVFTGGFRHPSTSAALSQSSLDSRHGT